MNYLETIENLLINFWFGNYDSYLDWLTKEDALLTRFPWLHKWIYSVLATTPIWGTFVIVCFLLAFIFLLCYFFYHLLDLLKPSLNYDGDYSRIDEKEDFAPKWQGRGFRRLRRRTRERREK